MKKLQGLVLTVALVATMVVPGLAAPSPTAEVVKTAANVTVEVAGVEAKAPSVELAAEVMKITSMPTVLADLGVASTAKLTAVMEVSYEGTIPAGGVQIPLKVSTGKVGDFVYVLHRTPSGQWEKVGEGVLGADLTVVGTFTSFSPVAIMTVDAANIVAPVVAPKTGE